MTSQTIKVLLVHAKPLSELGGAELGLGYHLAHAPDNVSVDVILPDEAPDLSMYNIVILGNLRPSGGPGEKTEAAWAKAWTKHLKGFKGYSIKSERDVHPCGHRDGRCLSFDPIQRHRCDCSNIIPKAFEALYNTCSAVQFLSPLHQKAINMLIRVKTRQYVIASPIDLSLFRNIRHFELRKKAALIIGDKIRVAPTAEHRASILGFDLEWIDYLSIPHAEMPALYNRYQAVVVDPVMFHAFGRIAIETLACGCKVLASNRVGAFSWDDPLEACRRSNKEFWNMALAHHKHEIETPLNPPEEKEVTDEWY